MEVCFTQKEALYEANYGSNTSFSIAITINGRTEYPDLVEQYVTFRIPVNPTVASNHSAAPGGPIRIAFLFFNQFAGVYFYGTAGTVTQQKCAIE